MKLGKGSRNGRGNRCPCDRKGEAEKHGDAVFLRLSLIKRVWGGRGEFEGGKEALLAPAKGRLPPSEKTSLAYER